MYELIYVFTAVAVLQTLLYQVRIKQVVPSFLYLVVFYTGTFFILRGLDLLVHVFKIELLRLPLILISLVLISKIRFKHLPVIEAESKKILDFYLLTSILIGMVWLACLSVVSIEYDILSAISLSFLLIVCVGLREHFIWFKPPSFLPWQVPFFLCMSILLIIFNLLIPLLPHW